MTNHERIIEYYINLCNSLNDNGYRIKGQMDGKPFEIKYKVNKDHPDLTMMAITENIEAYRFLQEQGLLRKDMCQFCGEFPVEGSYTFKEPINKITLNICRNCHPKGKLSGKSGNSGCMFLILIPLILSIALFYFII